jgi:hypothetical protein
MNVSPTLPQTPVNAETRPREATRDADPRATQERRDLFEQLLRAKEGQLDEGEDEAVTPDAGANGIMPPALSAALQTARPAASAPAPAAVETVKTGTRAAIETALTTNAPAPVTPVGATEPAAVWEASVREANSVAVEVRFTRPERAAHETQANWTLTVGSSTVNAEMLARHAPRLNERLRKRAIGLDHVRIQRDEGDA